MLEQLSDLACGTKRCSDEDQSIKGDLTIGLEPLNGRFGNTRHLRQGLAGEVLCESRFPCGYHQSEGYAIEKDDLSVWMIAYARVLAALDSELNVIPAAMPTLDEISMTYSTDDCRAAGCSA